MSIRIVKRKFCKVLTIIAFVSVCFVAKSQSIDNWQIDYLVNKMFKQYPCITLQDIYKTCFQDVFGPEHLVSDTQKVLSYIDYETKQQYNEAFPLYEYCGMEGNFVRVNVSAVKQGYIDMETLADCFIASASKEHTMTISQWTKLWREICGYIEVNYKDKLSNFQADSLYIENLLGKGEYAWVHSRAFHDTYLPHYRIIAKDLFVKKIYPKLLENIR